MGFKNYWYELKRRHVVKSGIAYLVMAWLIVQVISILIPLFNIPDRFLKTFVIILIIGFPIWLILAWIYDFTPSGLVKTESQAESLEVSAKKNLKLNRIIIGGLSIAIVLLVVNQFRLSNVIDDVYANAMSLEFKNSIAVLPFKDLSSDNDQEYFSDGMSEALISVLTRAKDLKVTASRSSFFYKNKNLSVGKIAAELGVDFLLDGNVRKEGDRFRVSVQLIDAKSEAQIWSKDYDRKVEDIIYTQVEISKIVADQLEVTLKNKDVLGRKVDLEAYILFSKAYDLAKNINLKTIVVADSLIRKSLEIDDTYAPAWATMSQTTFWNTYYFLNINKELGISKGIEAAKMAIDLNPNLPSGYIWLSNFYWREKNIEGYEINIKKSLELGPNDPEAIFNAGWSAQRTNQLDRAYEYYKKALVLDPNNLDLINILARFDLYFENYDSAILRFKKFIEHVPYTFNAYNVTALAYLYKGDILNAHKYAQLEPQECYKMIIKSQIYFTEKKIQKSDSLITEIKNKNFPLTSDQWANFSEPNLNAMIGAIYAYQGENDLAFEYLNNSLEWIYNYTEVFFTSPELKNLHDDPRWDKLLDKVDNEFNYDFKKNQ